MRLTYLSEFVTPAVSDYLHSPVFYSFLHAATVMSVGVTVFEEEDEPLVDAALAGDVFTFIRNCVVANADFHHEVCRFLQLICYTFCQHLCQIASV